MDAVEREKSGHPGLPMGAADVATVLYTRFYRHFGMTASAVAGRIAQARCVMMEPTDASRFSPDLL